MKDLEINSSNFYGKRRLDTIPKNVVKRAHLIKENPITGPKLSTILGETQIWKIFNRQKPALEYVEKNGLGLMVFAFEGKAVGEGGRRCYNVCHPKTLWERLKNRPINARCTYEVIPENAPCKLYFDLEFLIPINHGIDGVYLTKIFIEIINFYLQEIFNIKCSTRDILQLDSTNEKKFSMHLIYNSPKVVFQNNIHIGQFVKIICDNLRKTYEGTNDISSNIPNITKDDIKKLFVVTDSENGTTKHLFCDEGVYTKNRNFRIYKSTKYRKQTPLIVAPQNQYIPTTGTDEESYFLSSLVTMVPDNPKEKFLSSQLKPEAGKTCYLKCDDKANDGGFKRDSILHCSPHPKIEHYINDYLGEVNVIRNWLYFHESDTFVLDIDKKHRFCHNINREHKSNAVFYVVNLQRGVFYQKCHDPNCKDFRSNEITLPPETLPSKSIDDSFLSHKLSSDKELLASKTLKGT